MGRLQCYRAATPPTSLSCLSLQAVLFVLMVVVLVCGTAPGVLARVGGPDDPCSGSCNYTAICSSTGTSGDGCRAAVQCVTANQGNPDFVCHQPCISDCANLHLTSLQDVVAFEAALQCGEECYTHLSCTGHEDCLDHLYCAADSKCRHCTHCFEVRDQVNATIAPTTSATLGSTHAGPGATLSETSTTTSPPGGLATSTAASVTTATPTASDGDGGVVACPRRCLPFAPEQMGVCGLCSCLENGFVSCRNIPSTEVLLEQLAILPAAMRHLDLWRTGLTSIPITHLARFTSLEVLDLSFNFIQVTEPMQAFFLPKLHTLDLSFNLITHIAPGALSLPSLRILNLASNRLPALTPEWMRRLPHLVSLDLSRNAIAEVAPKSLVYVQQLQVLDLSNNALSRLESGRISPAPRMQTLQLHGNPLTEISGSPFAALAQSSLLRTINLTDTPITALPHTAFTVLPPRRAVVHLPYTSINCTNYNITTPTATAGDNTNASVLSVPHKTCTTSHLTHLPTDDRRVLVVDDCCAHAWAADDGRFVRGVGLLCNATKALIDPVAASGNSGTEVNDTDARTTPDPASTSAIPTTVPPAATASDADSSTTADVADTAGVIALGEVDVAMCTCLNPEQELLLESLQGNTASVPTCPAALLGTPAYDPALRACSQPRSCHPQCDDISGWEPVQEALEGGAVMRLALQLGLNVSELVQELGQTVNIFEQAELGLQGLETQLLDFVLPHCPRGTYADTSGGAVCNVLFRGRFAGVEITLPNTPFPITVGQGFCRPCASTGCEACDATSRGFDCRHCTPGLLLHEGACVTACPAGYSGNNDTCQPCTDTSCIRCPTDPAVCQVCTPAAALHEGHCVARCPAGTYTDQDQGGFVCRPCMIEGCERCTGATSCETCSAGFYLFNSTCVQLCPAGTYPLGTEDIGRRGGVCWWCTETNCLKCASDVCTWCSPASSTPYLLNGRCIDREACEATDGRVPDMEQVLVLPRTTTATTTTTTMAATTSHASTLATKPIEPGVLVSFLCRPCLEPNCRVCNRNDACRVCHNNHFLFERRCVLSCPLGFHPSLPASGIGGVCDSCGVSRCLACSRGPGMCSRCEAGLFVSTNRTSCVSLCPSGSRPVGNLNANTDASSGVGVAVDTATATENNKGGDNNGPARCEVCPSGSNCHDCNTTDCLSCDATSPFPVLRLLSTGRWACTTRTSADTASRTLSPGQTAAVLVVLLVLLSASALVWLYRIYRKRYAKRKTYHFFISYRHDVHDALAQRLCSQLQRLFLTTGHRVVCFLDKQDIRQGDDWRLRFRKGLTRSCAYLPLISRSSLQEIRQGTFLEAPDNLLTEMELALQQKRAGRLAILPLLVSSPQREGKGADSGEKEEEWEGKRESGAPVMRRQSTKWERGTPPASEDASMDGGAVDGMQEQQQHHEEGREKEEEAAQTTAETTAGSDRRASSTPSSSSASQGGRRRSQLQRLVQEVDDVDGTHEHHHLLLHHNTDNNDQQQQHDISRGAPLGSAGARAALANQAAATTAAGVEDPATCLLGCRFGDFNLELYPKGEHVASGISARETLASLFQLHGLFLPHDPACITDDHLVQCVEFLETRAWGRGAVAEGEPGLNLQRYWRPAERGASALLHAFPEEEEEKEEEVDDQGNGRGGAGSGGPLQATRGGWVTVQGTTMDDGEEHSSVMTQAQPQRTRLVRVLGEWIGDLMWAAEERSRVDRPQWTAEMLRMETTTREVLVKLEAARGQLEAETSRGRPSSHTYGHSRSPTGASDVGAMAAVTAVRRRKKSAAWQLQMQATNPSFAPYTANVYEAQELPQLREDAAYEGGEEGRAQRTVPSIVVERSFSGQGRESSL